MTIHFGTFGESVLPSENKLAAGEVRALSAKAQVVDRMTKAALSGVDSADGDGVIREIHLDIDERVNRSNAQAAGDIKQRAFVLSNNQIEPINADLTIAETMAETEQAKQERSHDCEKACVEANRTYMEYKAHRARHNIQRDTLRPEKILTLALLMVAAIFETAIGIFFYKDVSDNLVEAAKTAGLAAGVVTLVGLGIGWCAQWAINGYGLRQRLAQGGVGALSFVAFIIGEWLSHDRDNLASYVPGETFIQRLDPALAITPWEWLHFETTQGPMLLIFTLGLAALAAYKGYSGFSDPIPGYSRVDELRRNAANHAADRQTDLREATRAPIQEAAQRLKAERLVEIEKVKRAAQAADEAEYIEVQYRQAVELTHGIGNTVIRIAKDTWLAIRPELPGFFRTAFYSEADTPPLTHDAPTVRQAADAVKAQHRDNDIARTTVLKALAKHQLDMATEIEAHLASIRNLAAEQYRQSANSNMEG